MEGKNGRNNIFEVFPNLTMKMKFDKSRMDTQDKMPASAALKWLNQVLTPVA